jgi:hypothetical protein
LIGKWKDRGREEEMEAEEETDEDLAFKRETKV